MSEVMMQVQHAIQMLKSQIGQPRTAGFTYDPGLQTRVMRANASVLESLANLVMDINERLVRLEMESSNQPLLGPGRKLSKK